jgi:hypothetical protein
MLSFLATVDKRSKDMLAPPLLMLAHTLLAERFSASKHQASKAKAALESHGVPDMLIALASSPFL